jgi:hypothetical protein
MVTTFRPRKGSRVTRIRSVWLRRHYAMAIAFLFFEHDITPNASASSEHVEGYSMNDLVESCQGIERGRLVMR